MYTEEEKDRIFQKCRAISGMDSRQWRIDSSGAIIRRTSYGRDDELYGWEIDHVVPIAILEKYHVPTELQNNETNLRALNWNNNVSKGDSYPKYNIVITSEDDGRSNTYTESKKTVNSGLQERLRALYADYINFDEL